MELLTLSEKQDALEKKEEKLAHLLQQLAEDTSLHGFKQIHYSKGPRKYVWLISLILAITLVTILFRSTVIDYLNYKTYIETDYKEDIRGLPFPTVTLCFSDNFVDHKYKNFPANITLEQYKRIFSVIHMDNKVGKEDIVLFESLNISSYEELVRSIHLTLEDTVLYNTTRIFNHEGFCSFSRQRCTLQDLKLVWQIRGAQSCLQFNSYNPGKKPREQTKVFSPFRVYLDVRAKDNRDFFSPGLFKYGFMVLYVHPYGTPHEMYYGRDGKTVFMDRLYVTPGTLRRFYMSFHQINHMTPPYGSCGTKEMKVMKYYPYTINACIMDCILQYNINKCGCIRFDLKYAVGDDIPVCTISQMVRCYIPTNSIARRESVSCMNACPFHCRRYEFTINKEDGIFPTHHNKKIEKFLVSTGKNNSETTEGYIRGQIIGVEVRYRKMRKHTETYRQLVSLATLLATIGGSIGLGMGLSLLTVVEFSLFVVDSMKIMIMVLRTKLNRYNENSSLC